MARIVLIRPPPVYSVNTLGQTVVPPLNLAYIAGSLIQEGHSVSIIDALGAGIDHHGVSYSPHLRYWGLTNPEIVSRIPNDTDWVGLSCMFSTEWPHDRELIQLIKKTLPSVHIVLGGEHSSAMSEWILKTTPEVDTIIQGEGEESARQLSILLAAETTKQGAPRIMQGLRVKDIDSLPLPAWDLVDLTPYFRPEIIRRFPSMPSARTLPIIATRGCPYRCTFCSSPGMWTTKYTLRTPSKVVDEIQGYFERYRVTNFQFFDLTAMMKKSWIVEFCKEVQRRGLKFTFQLPQGTRSEVLDTEVLRLLKDTGFSQIVYAPESGSVSLLKAIKKQVNLSKMLQSMKWASESDLNVKGHIVMGFPEETRLQILSSFFFILRMAWAGANDLGLFKFIPYPGSEISDGLQKSGYQPEYDNAYFESLTINDKKNVCSVPRKISHLELNLYWWAGYLAFYFLSYFFHPKRIPRSLWRLITKKPVTGIEVRIQRLLPI